MKYFIILTFFLSFAVKSKEIVIKCEKYKELRNSKIEVSFKPMKRFYKYKDTLLSKKDVYSKVDGNWLSWCTDEDTKAIDKTNKENNNPYQITKSEKVLNKLSAECTTEYYNKKESITYTNIIALDFEFFERKSEGRFTDKNNNILSKRDNYFDCEKVE